MALCPRTSKSLLGFTLLAIFFNLSSISNALKEFRSPAKLKRVLVQASRPGLDLAVAESIAANNYKVQSVSQRSSSTAERRYGYPFAIAPTLPPFLKARSDDYENEATHVVAPKIIAVPTAKTYGSRTNDKDDSVLKKNAQKKVKIPFRYGATRRSYEEDSTLEKGVQNYREPKYRNFDELETRFRPRRIDYDVPYSQYEYSKIRRPVSPRDPYLSNADPTDEFYPKVNSYSPVYTKSGQNVAYGAGRYEDPSNYHSEHIHGGSYGLGSTYSSNGYGESPSQYPSTGPHYNYQEDYTIESNKPIIGDIRKRLLDYAGASDLYEGEPDYLREVARNKHKYGNLGNDYYSYGGQGYKNSYSDFPYVESKVSLVKKQRAS